MACMFSMKAIQDYTYPIVLHLTTWPHGSYAEMLRLFQIGGAI